MGLLLRTWLAVSVLSFALAPAWVEASPVCKSVRAKKKPVKKSAAKKPARAKVTAKTIALWQKKKMKDDQIVEKAIALGYKVDRAERKKLLKCKVKKPLIAKLELAQKPDVTIARAEPAEKAPTFDLDKTIDPNSIDFDSVPPPNGMPSDLAKKQKVEAEKKPLQQPAVAKTDDKPKRVVIAAQK